MCIRDREKSEDPQIALIGTAVLLSTFLKKLENGIPSSLAKAQNCLELARTVDAPIKNWQMMIRDKNVRVQRFPRAS